MRNKAAMVSLAILFIMTLAVIFLPMVAEFTYDDTDWYSLHSAPSAEHLFGTDSLGRDLYVRTLVGGRISLMVGVLGAFVAVLIGTLYGATSRLYRWSYRPRYDEGFGNPVCSAIYVSGYCSRHLLWS